MCSLYNICTNIQEVVRKSSAPDIVELFLQIFLLIKTK